MQTNQRAESNFRFVLRTPLSTARLQVEDTKLPTGERRLVKYFGYAPKSPEQILEDRESASRIDTAMGRIAKGDRDRIEIIFNEILQIEHFRDQSHLVDLISQRLGDKFPKPKVKAPRLSMVAQGITRHERTEAGRACRVI
jgi:hypothetical protein